jgi:hypothetical protein
MLWALHVTPPKNARVGEQRAERKSLPDTLDTGELRGESAVALRDAGYVAGARQCALHTC